MTPTAKRSLHALGGLLGLASVIFVGVRLSEYADQIRLDRYDGLTLACLLALALVYGVANFLLAAAWRRLLHMGGLTCSLGWAVRVYGLSQLAKYVPGNIFHLAGRQALAMSAGMPVKPLGTSMAAELGLLVFAGALFSLLVLPVIFTSVTVAASLVLFFGACVAGHLILRRPGRASVAIAFRYQILFLLVSGLIFAGTLYIAMFRAFEINMLILIIGAYVVAWLVGLLTPGAPAGLGVREIILLFLLQSQVPEDVLLMAVIIGRLVTVTGDLIFFLGCSLVGPKLSQVGR